MALPGVSVALPVHRDAGLLAAALECIAGQTLPELDIMLVLNGSDQATRARARGLARQDGRVRVLELPEANLAAACNAALEAARHGLVARMDADDLCRRTRLARQAVHMEEHPELAALGCAWELLDGDDQVIATVRPPTEPAALRWRLLLGNTLAHGSVMLRRDAVLRAGGYNTACARAQDYELWLRLAGRGAIGALPEVLYRHRARFGEDPGRSSAAQAAVAGPAMLEAWRGLPACEGAGLEELGGCIESALAREGGGDLGGFESLLERGPTREGLLAWLWAQWHHPPAPRRVAEVCRRARVREVGIQLRAASIYGVWLWGAGDHTRWLLENRDELGVEVLGIVDDAVRGQRLGFLVGSPEELQPGAHVLISSDWHEEAIWEKSAPARARGVNVLRMYGDA